jgi:heme/copper-type cytochrome/quinol oxidase subunit 3
MVEDLQSTKEPRVTALVNGIIHDAGDLLQQQMALFKHEVKDNLRKTKQAALSLSLGAALAITGGLFWAFMLVYLLHEVWPGLPLSACYGIVGTVLLVLGGAFLNHGRERLKSVSALPEQSAETLKENVAWIMKRK